jgi:hypothetical protein
VRLYFGRESVSIFEAKTRIYLSAANQQEEKMEQLFWLVPLGFAVGTFGTLIGAGGGFILMPILLVLYPDAKPDVLTAISLAVICGNSASGSAAYAVMKRIQYKVGLIFAAAAAPGAVLGAMIIDYIPRKPFNLLFGSVLLVAGVFLFVWKKAACADSQSKVTLSRSYMTLGIILSFGVGILSSLLGIGGGIIHVPALIYLLDFPVHIATATSHFILAVMALAGTIVHLANGSLDGQAFLVLGLSAGVIAGAQAGARLSNVVGDKVIVRGLAVGLVIAAAKIIFMTS